MPRFGKIIAGAFLALGLCCGVPLLLLDRLFPLVEEVVARVPSPDGRRTAVVTQYDGGATTSVGTVVTLEPGGRKIFEGYGAFLADGMYGVDLRWTDASTLDIHYVQAHRSRVFDQKEIKAIVRTDKPDDR